MHANWSRLFAEHYALFTLKAVVNPWGKIVEQPIEVLSFGGNRSFSLGYIILDLAIGPMQVATQFHMIDVGTFYHLLLGRPWIHKHKAVPSTYHQCLKAIYKDKKGHVNVSEWLFQRDEARFLEAVFFDELAEDGKVVPDRPRGIPLPAWEDLREQKF